jgi:hypothetical protein
MANAIFSIAFVVLRVLCGSKKCSGVNPTKETP